jgi:opacity protein-like surface antigen
LVNGESIALFRASVLVKPGKTSKRRLVNMKRYAFIAGMLFLSGTFVQAQEESTPTVEVGLNYSFVHRNNEQFTTSYGENGGSGYFAYNVNRTFDLVADLGGYDSGNYNRQTFSYLFGPRVNLRKSRIVPYVEFLFGGAYEWGVINSTGISATQNGFATAAGGGIDINVTQHIAVKPIQVEYLMTQLPQLASNLNSAQNNLRYSAGLVFRFGPK